MVSHGYKKPLETLEIHIANNSDENLNYKFKPKIDIYKNNLAIWKQRSLSLKGKLTISNNLDLALLLYFSNLIDVGEPAIKEINNIIQNFIWNGKTSKISHKKHLYNL